MSDNSDSILSFKQFSSRNYLVVSKDLIRIFGPEAAHFILNLIDKYLYFNDHGKLINEEWFYQLYSYQMYETGLPEYSIRKYKIYFQQIGVLKVKAAGLAISPTKELYKIDIKALLENIKANSPKYPLKTKDAQKVPFENEGSIYNNTKAFNNNKTISKDIVRNSRKEFPPLESSNNNSQIKISPKTVRRRTAPPRELILAKEWITSGWKKTILDIWNQIPDVRKHNDLTTKIICRAAKALEHLSRGSFFDHYKISDGFVSKNNIPTSWIVKKKVITQRQIFTAVSKYALYFKHGYWPTNKDSLPRSLDSFIYNEHTGGSFLLRLIANPDVKPIVDERREKDPNPQYTKYFQEKGLLKQFTKDEMGLVYSGIRAIENRVLSGDIFVFDKRSGRNDLIKLNQIVGQGKPGKLEPMFKNYASYLNQQNRLDKEKIFSAYGYFQEFLTSLRDYYSSFEVNV